jgi:Zn-finger nucleic acid-binding protein
MGGEGASGMTTVTKHTQGHYEVQETSYGEAYVWCPECVEVECDCGETLVLTASHSTCGCGADHAAFVGEELAYRRSSEDVSHPWDEKYREWRKKQEEVLHSESDYWLEWKVIE